MDTLQFQKAEYTGSTKTQCALCRGGIEGTYFHLNGQVICPACAAIARSGQQRPNHTWVLRGLLYGSGMAILCSIGYAIFTMATNMEMALISIAIGYLVGRAVRAGSHGLGGRRCQILAVMLTYFAIIMGYLPPAIKGMREATRLAAAKRASVKASQPNATAAAAQSDSAPVMPHRARIAPPVRWLLAAALVAFGFLLVAVTAPLAVLASGFGGIVSVLILFLGLQRAWKETARDSRVLMGPYEVEGAPTIA
jgi:hypothetical protein